ncbi:Ig-like domain-containing protein [Flammeovirga kamogawensis]|uniref:Ig-like domain-containing protein n=1 Tax=Flammeovirga kamogawensis TaxID=373891 RepID=A0ABX8H366_9BACT|nr:Ig-like domain-containing protein [Flammeovirga kamogawensis]MBB6460251.1 uncharacterized protein YjdB [Flammeovirga kamogawensis]QWG10064.1 Ig-like domain-containing protein [Flammeovirga kamogawensis]TRX65571.1 family 16 glycosylhydrolase [Flammeovirga kamogawensis]
MKSPRQSFRTNFLKHLVTGIMSLLIIGSASAQKPLKTENATDEWVIKWNASDEFNGSSPDWAKWIRSGNLPNTTAWKWDNAQNVVINNGVAELTMRQNPNNANDGNTFFKSGILKTYNTFTYGYFEAKIKGADIGEGVCPSFWLYSNFDYSVGEGKTVYSEIDVVELQQFDWYEGHQDDIQDMDLNLHAVVKQNGEGVWRRPKAYPEEQLNKWRAPWDPTEDYHIYGCEVNEQEIIWYVDGVERGRKPNTYWHRPMNVTLSLGLRKPFVKFYDNRNNAVNPETDPQAAAKLSGMPTTMYVDYVRVWLKSDEVTPPPPSLGVGVIGNPSFETGDLTNWDASYGNTSVVNNNAQSGTKAGTIDNASIAQVVTLKANTTYKVGGYAKVGAAGTNAFMGVNKASTNEFIQNYEFTSTSYTQGEITLTTGAAEETYRIWFWSQGQAYCDNFTLVEVDGGDGGNEGPSDVAVTGVTINSSSITLNEGDTQSLSATVLPSNATNKAVTWSVVNNTIASVNNNGLVTALSEGTTSVRVTTADGAKQAVCTITVNSTSTGGGNGALPEVGQVISLITNAGNYVTVNTGSGTALQGTQSSVSTKEQFRVVDANGYLGLQSVATNKYVTTASNNAVKCGASGVFERQKYTIELSGNGIIVKSKINGNYWSVNSSSSNALNADASSVNNAEVFVWEEVGSSSRKLDNYVALEQEISIYPNPYTMGLLMINFGQNMNGKVNIIDLSGKIVFSSEVNDQKSVAISKSELAVDKGLYIIQLIGDNVNTSKKLIIE